MMNHISIAEVPEVRPRRVASAPPILVIHGASKQVLNKFIVEEKQEKSCLRPFSDTWHKEARSIKSCSNVMRPDASQLLQYGEKKEKTWLSDVFTKVGSLSRGMEKEKRKENLTICSANLLGLVTPRHMENVWIPKGRKGRIYQDWRGVILSETMTPYTLLSNEAHQKRLMTITRRKRSEGTLLLLCGKLEKQKREAKKRRKRSHRKKHSFKEKVKRIGPHLEIFEAFSNSRKAPKKNKIIAAATCIQKLIRGWLDRIKLRRLRMKAKSHGTDLLAVVKEYRKMMYRIKHRCGILDLTTPLVFDQLEDWLDKKKFYETMFAKREFLKEMDINDIPRFFRDCGRFPTKDEMDNAVKLVLGDYDPKIRSINKTQAVEMAFMLYPPCGLKLKTAAVAKSTWLKPIIDGEDGYRYLVSGHPALKAADIRKAGALVAASIRERKRKECEADNYLVDSD